MTVDMPFVCKKVPFVWRGLADVRPFVPISAPFVCLGRHSSGVTLIELMMVLVIAVVLLGISAPSFQDFILNNRISGQTNDFVSDLAFARSEAIKRALPVTVCKTLNPSPASGAPTCNATVANPWTTGRLIFVDSGSGTATNNGNGVLDTGELILRVRQPLDGGQNRLAGDGTAAGTANKVLFLPNGTTGLTAGAEYQWILCDKRGNSVGRAIVINPIGRVRVPDPGIDMGGAAITCPS